MPDPVTTDADLPGSDEDGGDLLSPARPAAAVRSGEVLATDPPLPPAATATVASDDPPLPPPGLVTRPLPGPGVSTGDEPELLVSTRALTKRYGSLVALHELDLDVPKGAIYGIIGPNGAGKSTTFAILATLLTPTAGTARVCGADPVSEPRKVRGRLGYMPDVMGVYESLKVTEYLEFHAAAYGVPRDSWGDLVEGLLELVDLDVKRNAMVDSLSRGMKQRLSLARSLVHDPDLLILDEPASGLDPRARIEFRQLLAELQRLGKTILISSHILAELQQMCTDIAVIEAGRLLAAGSPERILAQLGTGRRVEVRYLDGTVADFPVADESEQAELLRRLLAEGRDVVEFTVASHDLEDLFLELTEGVVQ